MNKILSDLFSLEDKEYRDFNSKLIPNIPKENVIGIRVPVLRKYAKEIKSSKYVCRNRWYRPWL